MKRRPASVHLSELKPGLNAAVAAFARTRIPVAITSSVGEVLAQFAPSARYTGDLSAAFPVTADRFRKRRARLVNGVYWGLTLIVKQRNGREFVFFPPAKYRDDFNPHEIARKTRERLFGTRASGGGEFARLEELITRLGGQIATLIKARNLRADGSKRPRRRPRRTI
jgi:hypothetical protein